MFNLSIFLFFILNLYFVNCDPQCDTFDTCGKCIGSAFKNCVWCSAKNHTDRRCRSKEFADENKSWCKVPVYNPQTKQIVELDNPFSSGENKSKVVQFKPQQMTVRARSGVPVNFVMSYKPAVDYPLDVYYLMDYSFTMRKHRDQLEKQGREIYQQLSNITNNVRLGVGSFVEKPGVPYASPEHTAYSFKNHLSLTKNMEEFANVIRSSPFGSNYDDPEAALDALMQAMACEKELGWRNKARRIIVLCTDSTYHSAGDGKMVGAAKPNDMECHLDNGTYSMALTRDYPSVSQINKVATDQNFKIIFAAVDNVKHEYEALAGKIQGAKYVELKSNIVNIIITEYMELLENVQIDVDVPPHIQLSLNPDCRQDGKCKVKHQKDVKITGILKVQSCPKDSKESYVKINPVGLSEKLMIKVDAICQCDCEKDGKGEINSKMCSESGTYQCGVCKCNEDRRGSICQCIGSSTDKKDSEACKANANDTSLCSGHGTCSCGKCVQCQTGYSGDFCEFDDNACARPEGKLCAGNGLCQFGKCLCNPHWTGSDCRCPDHDRDCIAEYSDKVCFGNGECKCGKCYCKKSDKKMYSGKFCFYEEYSDIRCKELQEYAYCNYNHNKTFCDNQFNQTSNADVFIVNKTEINAPVWHLAKWCRKELDDGNFIVFRYLDQPKLQLIIQKEFELPPKANIWIAVGSAIGIILLIGLLTVFAWKILIDIHDQREYNKFSDECTAAGFDVSLNPLYQAPAVNFSNPTYNNRCSN